MTGRVVRRAQTEGEFTGFDGETLFALTDGSFWLQDEYRYWYQYAYRPEVIIVETNGRLLLGVPAFNEFVAVRQIFGVIEAQIAAEFSGWNGDSEYTLTNGQTWKQSTYKYEYKYAYRPRARIYDPGGGHVMEVAGTRARVKRLR